VAAKLATVAISASASGLLQPDALAAISDMTRLEKHDPSLPECPLSPLRPITQQHSTADAAKANARWNTILRGTMIACGHGRGGGDAQQA
jgi:hypothetical protein